MPVGKQPLVDYFIENAGLFELWHVTVDNVQANGKMTQYTFGLIN